MTKAVRVSGGALGASEEGDAEQRDNAKTAKQQTHHGTGSTPITNI